MKQRKTAAMAAVVLGLVLAGCGGVWMLRQYLASAPAPTKPVVQEIRIVRPPPPPEEEPPPPPPPEEEVDIPEPEPMDQPEPSPSDEPPPGEQLGLDAEGTAGSDGFGLVGRKGGRDLLAGGGGAYIWYAGLLKNELLDELGDDAQARNGSYSVMVRIWVRPDGTVEQIRLVTSTGNTERDRAIETALARVRRLSQPPPAQMPQPISLRIVSRV